MKSLNEVEQMAKDQQECGSRFTLLKKIGEGTYGVVYKAKDAKYQGKVSKLDL